MVCGIKVRFVNTTGKIAAPSITVEEYILENCAIHNNQLSYPPNPLKAKMVQRKHKVDLTYIVNYGKYILNLGLFALIILLSEEEKRFL